MAKQIPLTEAYSSVNRKTVIDSCVNWIPCVHQDKKLFLINTPGLLLFKDFGLRSRPVRNMIEFGSYLYAVIGNTVYKVGIDATYTALSTTLDTGSGYVWMYDNGTQIMIVDGAAGYIVASDVVTKIIDPDFPIPSSLSYVDGYFIVTKAGTHRFYISDLLEGTSWVSTEYTSAEGNPDNLVGGFADHREYWAFGTKTIEVFYNSGNADFPFERIQGAFIQDGLSAAASPASLDNSIFWLDDKRIVRRANGYLPLKISTEELDYHLASYSSVSDAIGYSYTQEGHGFYVLTFPSANVTWVYDVATQLWHRRASTPETMDKHRGACYVNFQGKHIIGDAKHGILYEYDLETYTDNEEQIRRICISPPIETEQRTIFFSSYELQAESGVGLLAGQGYDPQVILQWSDDDGHTWSNELWRSMGKMGEYGKEIKWYRLGRSKKRRFKITVIDPVKVLTWAGYTEVTVGN